MSLPRQPKRSIGIWVAVVLLAIGFMCVIGILIARQTRLMGNATATAWVTGATALATLAAVGTALWGASAAAETARAAEATARAAEDEAKSANLRADEEAARSELIRHEAVRPIASIKSYRYEVQHFSVRFDHEAGGAGFDVQAAVVLVANATTVWLVPPDGGGILQPRYVPNPPPIEFYNSHTQFPHNELVKVVCYFLDSIGWWWKQESEPFHLDTERPRVTGHATEGVAKLKMPEHCSAPDMTTGIRAW